MRKPRNEVAGQIAHVFARGNNHQDVFLTADDRETYLAGLAVVVGKANWRVLAWCLMTNHIHLVVETTGADLGRGMQRLQGNYASEFNRRHGRANHLWGNRFDAVPILDDTHLWTAVRYVVRNPVEAGLVTKPADYAWGSHAGISEGSPSPSLDVPRLLELFSIHGGDPLDRYISHVETA